MTMHVGIEPLENSGSPVSAIATTHTSGCAGHGRGQCRPWRSVRCESTKYGVLKRIQFQAQFWLLIFGASQLSHVGVLGCLWPEATCHRDYKQGGLYFLLVI